MTKKKNSVLGIILTLVLLAACIAAMYMVYTMGVLPLQYFVIVCIGLLALVILVGVLTWNLYHQVRFLIGLILWFVLMLGLVVGGYYLYRTQNTLSSMLGVRTEIVKMGVYVRADDAVSTVNDTASSVYGVLANQDRENTEAGIEMLKEKLGSDIEIKEYDGIGALIESLLKKETDVLFLNTAYMDVLKDIEEFTGLDSKIRTLSVENVEMALDNSSSTAEAATEGTKDKTEVETEEAASAETAASSYVPTYKNDDPDIYTFYISGIDTEDGAISRTKSEVNIVLSANLKTKQMVITYAPADYFVPLSISGDAKAKLMYAGIYGINVSVETEKMLYDIDIDDYIRVNFGGIKKLIDSIGTILIYSETEFTTAEGYHYTVGPNYVNADQAMAFVRQGNDGEYPEVQKGKKQLEVLKGIVRSMDVSEIISNFSTILTGLMDSFETNVGYAEIITVFRAQINDAYDWNMVHYGLSGTVGTGTPYTTGIESNVVIPDQTSVDHARELILKVWNGETISQ